VLYVSTITINEDTKGEYTAAIWQGPVPEDLKLHHWLNTGSDTPQMLLIWEAGEQAAAWVEEIFTTFGTISTTPAQDATPGLMTCWHRDLDGFAGFFRSLGVPEASIEAEMDVRRRGMAARTRAEAVEAGRAWSRQQTN
jgi:hypothetical protein